MDTNTESEKRYLIDAFVSPVHQFIKQEKSSGIVLGVSVLIAFILANSPWVDEYFGFFAREIGFYFNGVTYLSYSIYHWINDGLMAIFFFVVGLELKREFVEGELSNPRTAILPIAAAVGGMLVPAIIYHAFNPAGPSSDGWGIPMATDIAFALVVLYMFGKNVPSSVKIFLAALAIVDDLGAVLVIAFFYTSDISFQNLFIGFVFASVMLIGNKLGIRNLLFYAVLGVAGVWTAFLLSGVHATIAAVISAFTIPADVRLTQRAYRKKMKTHLKELKAIGRNDRSTLSKKQVKLFYEMKEYTNAAIPPLQRLEHSFHPIAMFIVLPIFAIVNAGVALQVSSELWTGSVTIGVALGLLIGKPLGIIGSTCLLIKLKISQYPGGMNFRHLAGVSFLASIGFTMSIFITSLAFNEPAHFVQAKLGIFIASIAGGALGYMILKRATGKPPREAEAECTGKDAGGETHLST
ncbi:MAG: Na+/H+ antiporter NhaA [Tannerellaceae bacterium]|nr:Na+/H+ antiporter NhaA [Tannerellaceae bacterium]